MKNQIRQKIKSQRNSLSKEEVFLKSNLASDLFLSSEEYISSSVIMLYMPLGNETDTLAIISRAFEDGKKVVLPVTDVENVDIIPYYISDISDLRVGAYAIREPQNGVLTAIDKIDTVVVPGIAFDCHGGRIGFGKGYYDRFLSAFNGIKIGFCYDFQLVENAYPEPHDVMMDYVVTNKEIFKCK